MKDFAKKYLDLLTGKFSTINLTRIEDFDSFYNKQILDSVEPVEKSRVFENAIKTSKIVVDVGFGGGFPIMPLAYKMPNIKFFGFEARAKKASVVTEIAELLEIKNVSLLHQRLEDIFFDVDVVITLKAVGKIDEFLEKINTDRKIKIFFYKGPNYKELEDFSKLNRNWHQIEEMPYDIEGSDGRVLIGFQNKYVPRGTSENKKLFSSLL